MKRVRWGILSTAKIGTQKVIPAMQNARYTDVAAIASRDRGRAEQVSARLGIPRSYGSYDALLADPQIDAIYNPLPNHLHVEWSIKCLEAGKHVLCEKPIGLSVAEAEQLEAAGESYPRLKLMEAFMYRHHPQWIRAKQLVEDGAIGTLKTMHSFFSYHNVDPGNIRNQAEIGGGGLMDIGCYPISASRFIYGSEPRNVSASIEIDRTFQTDSYGSVALEFEGGTSTFSYSTQLAPYQRVNIFGTDGRIEIQIPFNAPPDSPSIVNLQRGSEFEVIEFPVVDQYTLQAENMSLAILNDTPVATPVEDAVANMRVIERVFVSSRERSWA